MSLEVIYSVFNKKHLIPEIVQGLKMCFPEDRFIFILDACTDGTLEEYEDLISPLINYKIIVPSEELFETKANNLGLRSSTADVMVLFQDDMVCDDPFIKDKINDILTIYGNHLGLLGGRDGFELKEKTFPEKPVDKVSSWVHKAGGRLLKEGEFAERTVLNRGPIVFTRRLLDTVGYLNEDYAPLWGDDMDYCFRAKFKHGLTNVVFQCNIKSPLEWGTTRKGTKLNMGKVMRTNWNRFISEWGDFI